MIGFLWGLLLFFSILTPVASGQKTCNGCHSLELDASHNLPCTQCHQGKSPASGVDEAHEGLVAEPALGGKGLAGVCFSCHSEASRQVTASKHYLLTDEVNLVRQAFGLPPVPSVLEIPRPVKILDVEDLVNDLLRRRCLRCHVYDPGDTYPQTTRGTGCAACHLTYRHGELVDHRFTSRVPDETCLHCHYGNFVGWDYYGRFDHDYPASFRSPLRNGAPPPRPYGVEYFQLTPDVHQQAGLSCIDCHQSSLMGRGKDPSCLDCHKEPQRASGIVEEGGRLVFVSSSGRRHLIPKMKERPSHREEIIVRARCSACHASFTYWDEDTYLLRLDAIDYEDWVDLLVQGSSEVEELILEGLTSNEPPPPYMQDKFNHKYYLGLWLKGFKERRWERFILVEDDQGRLSLARPLLKIYLSYVNKEEDVLFDNFESQGVGLLPYSPHTIGPADFFRSLEIIQRIKARVPKRPVRPSRR
ncbi:hypothetical protein [Thermosulfuriphilus sp.]